MPDAIRVAQQQHQSTEGCGQEYQRKKDLGDMWKSRGFLQHKKSGDSANQPEGNSSKKMNVAVVAIAGRQLSDLM